VDSAGQFDTLPYVETDSVSAETCGASHRGVDNSRMRQQGTTSSVEVIEVVIVAEKDGINRRERVCLQRGSLGLA
jgi:hypothetical protein